MHTLLGVVNFDAFQNMRLIWKVKNRLDPKIWGGVINVLIKKTAPNYI